MHPAASPADQPLAAPDRRRALLLGCGGGSLRGVVHSLAVLRAELLARRFTAEVVGPAATADAVLAALAGFTRATRRGDAAVVVYVGHGLLVEHAGHAAPADAPPSPRYIQALVPSDRAAITSLDLGLALRDLAARADNVALILDCCHAAGLAADCGDAASESGARWNEALRAAIGARLAAPRRGGELDDVVRLVASATHEHAYEEPFHGDQRIGVFSRALAEVLAGTRDAPLAWSDVAAAVHARVHAVRPRQWVGLEGPRRRGLFTRAEVTSPAGGYPCAPVDGALEIPAGHLHGVRPGDRFAVVAPTGAAVLVAEVAAATATSARLACAAAPPGARAVCVRHRRPVGVVLLAGDPADVAWLRALAERAGCTPGAPEPAARVRMAGDTVTLHDPDDRAPILRVHARDPDAEPTIVRALRRLATWRRVRAAFVHPHAGADVCAAATRGPDRPRPLHAAPLHAGDTLHLRLTNTGRHAPLVHCAVLRVAADRSIVPLTRDALGVPLQAGETWDLGHREFADDRGQAVVPVLPGERREWLLVVGQPDPLDAHWLETAAVAPPPVRTRASAHDPPWCLALPYRVVG